MTALSSSWEGQDGYLRGRPPGMAVGQRSKRPFEFTSILANVKEHQGQRRQPPKRVP